MTDGIFHPDERSIVEETRGNGKISQWSGAEFVAIVRVAGNFFQTEIFVLPRSLEDDIPFVYSEERSDLWCRNDTFLKIREHLVRVTDGRPAGNGMATNTARLAKEEQCSALFRGSHGRVIASRELIDRGVGK